MDFKEHIIEKIVDITGLEREVVEKSVEFRLMKKWATSHFRAFRLQRL